MPGSSHGKNLRKGRFSESNRIYHITTATFDRQPLFKDLASGRIVVKQLKQVQAKAQTLAYVIMPDHLHWLMQLQENEDLGNTVKIIKTLSALEINRYLNRKGNVWQSGFHDHALRKEEDVQSIARYIIANPLRAGIIDKIDQYPLWDAIWL
ncbi:MAG: transposase [Gammaproteobacteria bacterium]|nr:transposase [Gammaproteobacteria bacterium]